MTGLVNLETRSDGTEYFLSNDSSVDYFNTEDYKRDAAERASLGLPPR
jgi:hypothetical protein